MEQALFPFLMAFTMLFGFDVMTRGLDGAMKNGFAIRLFKRMARFAGHQLAVFLRWSGRHAWRLIVRLGRALWQQVRRFLRWAWVNYPEALLGGIAGAIVGSIILYFYLSRLP